MITNWIYVIFSYLSLFVLGMADNIRGPLLTEIMTQFQLNHTQASFVFVTSSAMAFCSSLAATSLIRRFSILKVLGGACMALFLGFALVYFSSDYLYFLVGVALFGASMGLLGVTENLMASLSSTGDVRNKVISGLHSTYALSSFLAPLLVVVATSAFANWRASFLVVGVGSLLLALPLFWIHDKDHYESLKKETETEIENSKGFHLWRDGVILASYVGAEILVSSRIATFARETYAYDLTQAAELTSVFFATLLAGRLLFVFVKPAISLKTSLYVSLLSSLLLLVFGLFVSPWFLALTGLTMSFYYPFCIAFLSDKYPKQIGSIISKAMVGQSLIVVLMHLGVGRLSDMFGVRLALLLGAVFLFIPIAILYFDETKKREL